MRVPYIRNQFSAIYPRNGNSINCLQVIDAKIVLGFARKDNFGQTLHAQIRRILIC